MKNGLLELKTDTWTIIGAGAVFATILATIMLALHASTNAHIDAQVERLDARISEQGERMDDRLSEQNARLGARIDAQGARIDMLYDTMRNEHALILESIAGVAQRVSYIEGHLGIGRAADPEAAGPP